MNKKLLAYIIVLSIWCIGVYLIGTFARISVEAIGIAGCIPPLVIVFCIDYVVGKKVNKINRKKWLQKKKIIYRNIMLKNGLDAPSLK